MVFTFLPGLTMEIPSLQAALPPFLPTMGPTGSSIPDNHSSTDGPLLLGRGSCCPAVRTVCREARELASHFEAEKAALLRRICYLEQVESELRREVRHLSDSAIFLRQDIDFWKLGCLQAEAWRGRYAALERSLISGPAPPGGGVSESQAGAPPQLDVIPFVA